MFKRFVEASGQALGMANLDGRIIYGNRPFCRLLGEERPEDACRKDLFAYYAPETVRRLREEILPQVLREGQWVGEVALIDKQGQPTPTIENIFLLRDDTGAPLGFATVFTDISERLRLEEELRTYHDHLEDMIAARTAELQKSNALLQEQMAERRRDEEERARLTAILESTSDLVATARPEGQILYINAAGRRMLGWGVDEDIRGHVMSEVHPAWAWLIMQAHGIPAALARGIWQGETAVLNKDGRETAVSQVIMVHRSARGQPEYLSTIMRDISERKRAEHELREREHQRQRQDEVLFGLVSDGEIFRGDFLQAVTLITQAGADLLATERASVWLYDADYAVIRCIDLYEKSLNRHSAGDMLIAAEFPAYTHAHRRGTLIAAEDVYTDPRTREITAEYFRKHAIHALIDAPVWLESRIGGIVSFEHVHTPRVWTPEEKRLVTIMGVIVSLCYEITMRRRTEEVLRESEEKFRMIFEHAPVSISITDLEGRYIDCNAQMCERVGLSREEIIGHRPEEVPRLNRLEDPAQTGQLFQKILAQGWLHNEEVHVVRPFDNQRSTALLSARRITLAGKPCVISMAQDITERRRLEEQLVQAQKMESIGRLAGGVAHDFNNLLTAIAGNTELALRVAGLDPKVIARLQGVQQAAASAADLTKQLLAFSRKQIIAPQVIDLNELIWDMGKMLARLIGEDISLRSITQPGLHSIMADPGQVQQIVMNLAVNARDAMPDGGILTIETANVVLDETLCRQHAEAAPGTYVMLSLSDTGIGMPEEVKRHLFEPFFTTKALGKGTGLGLATVYGAVKQNGGIINVYSEPGQGTCFKVYFPKGEEAVRALPREPDAQSLPGGNETVLVVEDNPGVLEFTGGVLEQLGYHVLAASSGEEALTLAAHYEGEIGLLLSDVILPGMNGRQLAERLKAARPDLKILFCSGYTEDTIVHHGVLEQDLNFIGKPFSAHALAHKLREVLEDSP